MVGQIVGKINIVMENHQHITTTTTTTPTAAATAVGF